MRAINYILFALLFAGLFSCDEEETPKSITEPVVIERPQFPPEGFEYLPKGELEFKDMEYYAPYYSNIYWYRIRVDSKYYKIKVISKFKDKFDSTQLATYNDELRYDGEGLRLLGDSSEFNWKYLTMWIYSNEKADIDSIYYKLQYLN